ncbi:hypothetical protein V6N13_131788 [Hibiscus sabdariffa]|uniref:HIT-type domain-containing protein n=2 Tax=Hibiscus sabdariffa TaxID=183260 RepID=A0ABR1ZHA4_9ROSI
MGGPSRQCQVCNQAQSKYKCPSCLVPYCSLACFKTHKETPCVKPESTQEKPGANPGFQVERKLEVDDPSEVLQIMQMQAIASSDEVREALKDEHLQKLISNIDSSPDALNALDKAMGVDAFRIFSDKILSAINP